jgi:hypothetical protein
MVTPGLEKPLDYLQSSDPPGKEAQFLTSPTTLDYSRKLPSQLLTKSPPYPSSRSSKVNFGTSPRCGTIAGKFFGLSIDFATTSYEV